MYPLHFVLLPRKTVYTQLLIKLKTSIADLQPQLAPTTIFMDFETAAQNPDRTVFPGITLKCCVFHYTQAMEKNPTHWSTSHLQKQRRHSTTCKKSSCSTTLTNGFNRRRLVQCTKWPRRHWHTSQYKYIHGLCYNPMDRRWPTSMEPLQNRWTPYHKSHQGFAHQTEEESLPCAPKHLHSDQHNQGHPGNKWSNQNAA